jgi:hypothetical protein
MNAGLGEELEAANAMRVVTAAPGRLIADGQAIAYTRHLAWCLDTRSDMSVMVTPTAATGSHPTVSSLLAAAPGPSPRAGHHGRLVTVIATLRPT